MFKSISIAKRPNVASGNREAIVAHKRFNSRFVAYTEKLPYA